MGSKSVCESSMLVINDGRRQSVPLCAYRQTRYRPTYTTLTSAVSLHVVRQHLTTHGTHLDPLFDVRKYTHVVQIAGNTTKLLSCRFFLEFVHLRTNVTIPPLLLGLLLLLLAADAAVADENGGFGGTDGVIAVSLELTYYFNVYHMNYGAHVSMYD